MKTATKIALLASLFTASSLATAIEMPKRGYIMPGINTMKADSDWNANERLTGGSLKLGAEISQQFDLQAGIALARAQSSNTSYKQQTAGIDALWMMSRKSLRPFLLAGLGAENDKIQTATRKANAYAPYVNAGAGVQWSFDKDAMLQADLRYLVGVVNEDRWNQEYSRNLVGHVGFGLAFGNGAKAAPTPTQAPAPTKAPVATATPLPTLAPTATPVPTVAPTATPRPTVAPTAIPAPKIERITLSASSLFAVGKAELGADKAELDKLASMLKQYPETGDIQVNGYTDRLGNAKTNQALSQKRADAVKAYLVSKGVTADRIKPVGKGSADPVAKCDGVKKRAELVQCLAPDRRIEIEPITIQRQVK